MAATPPTASRARVLVVASDESVDWFRVITDLRRAGETYLRIARAVAVSESAVRLWAGGTEPRYRDGVALLLLWERVTGKTQECAPLVSRYSYRA